MRFITASSGVKKVEITHQGKTNLEFGIGMFTKMSNLAFSEGISESLLRPDCAFRDINNYLAYLDSQEETSEVNTKLYDLYETVYNILFHLNEDVNTLILKLQTIVSEVIELLDLDKLTSWLVYHSDIMLPELPYAYDALEPHIDAETMTLHHDKHHATYVANANAALEKHPEIGEDLEALLSDVEQITADIRQALINNGGGHLNHALFWELLSPEKTEISEELAAEIDATFGSFDAFKEAFTTAATTRFGSGWAFLVVNKEGKLEILSTANQDTPIMQGLKPILALDVWEHAYYLKYRNVRPNYVKAFFEVINWNKVNELYKAAK